MKFILSLLAILAPYALGASYVGFELLPSEIMSEGVLPNLDLSSLTRFSLTCKFIQEALHSFIDAKYYNRCKFNFGIAYEEYMADQDDLLKAKISYEIDGLKDGADDGLLEYLKTALFSDGPICQAPYYSKKRIELIKLILKHKKFTSFSTFDLEFLKKNVKEILPHIDCPVDSKYVQEYVIFAKRLDRDVLDFVLQDFAECEIRCAKDIDDLPLKEYREVLTVTLLLRLANDSNYEKVLDILEVTQIEGSVAALLIQFMNDEINMKFVFGFFKRFRLLSRYSEHLVLLCAKLGYSSKAQMYLRGSELVSKILEMIRTRTIIFNCSAESDIILETALIYVDDEEQLCKLIEEFGLEVSLYHLALASHSGKSDSFLNQIYGIAELAYKIGNDLIMKSPLTSSVSLYRYHKTNLPLNLIGPRNRERINATTWLVASLGWKDHLSDERSSELLRYELSVGAIVSKTDIRMDADLQNRPRTLSTLIDIYATSQVDLIITGLNPIARENIRLLALHILGKLRQQDTMLYSTLKYGRDDASDEISLEFASLRESIEGGIQQ